MKRRLLPSGADAEFVNGGEPLRGKDAVSEYGLRDFPDSTPSNHLR